MLPRTRSTFKLVDLQRNPSLPSSKSEKLNVEESPISIQRSPDSVGLRILIEKPQRYNNNVVNKSMLVSRRSGFPTGRPPVPLSELSFLQACFLCRKALNPEKDIYIYRGDQGFCSLECRCMKILMDERKERRERRGTVVDTALTPPSCRVGRKHPASTQRKRVPAAA